MNYGIPFGINIERCKEIARLLEANENWQSLMDLKLYCTSSNGEQYSDVLEMILNADIRDKSQGLAGLLQVWFENQFSNIKASPDEHLMNVAISNVMCAVALDRVMYKLSKVGEIKSNKNPELSLKAKTVDIRIEHASGSNNLIAILKFESATEKNASAMFSANLQTLSKLHNEKYLDRTIDFNFTLGSFGSNWRGWNSTKVSEITCNYFIDTIANNL